MKFGGRVVNDVTVLDVVCHVETPLGEQATGRGSMTMSNAWSWPSSRVDADQTLRTILELGRRTVGWAGAQRLAGHPLDIGHAIRQQAAQLAVEIEREHKLPEPVPQLAILMVISPLEAAVFDAHGRAAQTSSYRLLGADHVDNDLSHYLNDDFRGLYLDQFVLPDPRPALPLYHLVGALDPLDASELNQPVGDGRPETLDQWIEACGLTHLKIKLAGNDLQWDVTRVCRVSEVADTTRGAANKRWAFSLDFNEQCDSEEYVLQLLDGLAERCPPALARIQYIEQPTHRDLQKHPENTMHNVTQRLPVVIDESLVDFQSLLLARQQGYSGVALKACKGHGEALLMAAAAQHYNQFLCVQDLTCIGASLLHSASLAAHIPTVAAIESNGRQYCPVGNEAWLASYGEMFEVTNGTVPTGQLDASGLGFNWPAG